MRLYIPRNEMFYSAVIIKTAVYLLIEIQFDETHFKEIPTYGSLVRVLTGTSLNSEGIAMGRVKSLMWFKNSMHHM